MRDITFQWVEKQIREHPERFATDGGTTELIASYLEANNPGVSVNRETVKAITTIARQRRKFLELHPEFDLRTQKNNGGHKRPDEVVEIVARQMLNKGGPLQKQCANELRRFIFKAVTDEDQ